MGDLARGWAIVTGHLHAHGWATWIAIFTAVCVTVGIAWRQKDEKPDVESFRPQSRTPIQGSEKDYRRQP